MQPARTRSRALLPSLLCLLAPLLGASAHASRTAILPSVSAEHVSRHAPSGVELARRLIELSPAGLRVRERAGGADLEMIQDFPARRLWFVDRTRGVSHELPSDVHRPPDGKPAAPVGGLLGTVPCAGSARAAAERGTWRGRRVDLWRCLDERGAIVANEMLDARLGIVVRRQAVDGQVDELRDIREREFDAGHFSPPIRTRAVGVREFARGAPELGAFAERDRRVPSAR